MKLFTIFGDPVAHSRSPLMHNHLFNTFGINACYTRTHLIDGSQLRDVFYAKKLSGANVTVPHKEAAYAQCDEVRGLANAICAVNTLIDEDGKLIGYNTDAEGFLSAIKEFFPLKNALIIGAGGTARALAIVLRSQGISLSILNSSSNRLEYFQNNGFETYTWETFVPQSYDMIINTTSAGLSDTQLPLPQEMLFALLDHARCGVDVIYGKKTPFLKVLEDSSIPYKDGSDMLLEQGVLANHLFIDKAFTIDSIRPVMKQSFLF